MNTNGFLTIIFFPVKAETLHFLTRKILCTWRACARAKFLLKFKVTIFQNFFLVDFGAFKICENDEQNVIPSWNCHFNKGTFTGKKLYCQETTSEKILQLENLMWIYFLKCCCQILVLMWGNLYSLDFVPFRKQRTTPSSTTRVCAHEGALSK